MTEPNQNLGEVAAQSKKNMEKAIAAFKHEIGRVRTGRASLALLEPVRVDYFGTPTPLNQVATLGVPEPKLITISPWDSKIISAIEKAIQKSDLGLTPSNDGKIIRIAIPDLTEERRKELVKVVKKSAEDFRVEVRAHRRDAIHKIKELEKEKQIPEDESRRAQDQEQKLTDEYIARIDKMLEAKEQEILQI
ncbi:MAG: ribosome recycling factor [Deltaproteobacteria bacterium]|nr:ribosome recycling factor [Deltaproteobacteria bacterium]